MNVETELSIRSPTKGEAEGVKQVPQGEDEGEVLLGEPQLKPVAAIAEHGIYFVSSW